VVSASKSGAVSPIRRVIENLLCAREHHTVNHRWQAEWWTEAFSPIN
jgi:hypothetical protein